jgi:hypothetical protein
MKSTVTPSAELALFACALFTATAAAGAPPAPCADTEARLTQRLEIRAEAARAQSYGDALRGFAESAGQDALRRHREIAETVAARSQAAAADGMLRLAAAPGSAARSVSAHSAPRGGAETEFRPLPAHEATVALAPTPGCR